jgi:hypothetical protein
MSIYKPDKDRKKLIDEALKDLNPAIRDSAKKIIDSVLKLRKKQL